MCKNPVRVAVTGVTGRMGKAIVKYLLKTNDVKKRIILGAALSRLGSDVCGIDIGTYMNTDIVGIKITDNIDLIKNDFDILIDFTSPDVTIEYLKFCVMNNKNIIIGTTGFDKMQKNFIFHASKKIGIVCSANFSIGVTIMLRLLFEASKFLRNTAVDINIVDIHHNKKRDAPSGTALMMRNSIVNALRLHNNMHENHYFNNFEYSNKKESMLFDRDDVNKITIHSLRIGDVIGEHIALFVCSGERLEIIHKAFNREIFVNGALRSVIWLKEFNVLQGLFDLNDVLGLNN